LALAHEHHTFGTNEEDPIQHLCAREQNLKIVIET
jgi:hypothetical protein